MNVMCTQVLAHDGLKKARNDIGDLLCVIDFPIILDPDRPDIYWEILQDGTRVAFDDSTRIATEYPPPGPDPQEPVERPYDDVENATADQRASATAAAQAEAAYERAVGLNAAPAELAALQEANLANSGLEPGDPWRQPTGAHDAYPLDALVSHSGKNWRSTIAANVWEPGVSGWVEDGEGIPDWVQPTGAHDAYPLGAIVRHIGLVWQSNVDANVWEPPTQWTEIPDPEEP